ncbi:DUF4892 domain-containing protein [Neptuniibacter sp.]|uniref:DUF4892 domain-containing protein n=1 Tax=Neptuniibacter sp. TaxID=1962643 RepID=UPI0026153BBE|nr:DUF4892 domain-containing protein [Neptuniibacter sp.]MCP4598216.1 DUF4892 domain-containing protein [Neptuniibacter sp.]
MKRFFWILSLTLLSGLTMAASDIHNSSDLDSLERFPRSFIVQYEQKQNEDYRLVLGGLEKINGVLVTEKEKRLAGLLTQITYRIPENHSAQQAFNHFQRQLTQQGATELFFCSGRDCGSSNQWANSIFRYFRLYGVDKTQSFASYQLNNTYFSLYSVKRGNKRVYLRVDALASQVEEATDKLPNVSGVEIQETDNDIQMIINYLESSPSASIWLAAFDLAAGSRSEQLKRSETRLTEFKSVLIDAGVAVSRINVHPVGSFVPPGALPKDKILIVYSEE